ncbi:MAG: hypothetical protein RR653_12235 [Clostridia bacterium]
MADWLKIKAEYISGCGSMRELAQKHGMSLSAIKRRSAAEGWTANRTETAPIVRQKTVQRIIEKTVEQEATRIARLLAIGDKLSGKLDRAVEELGSLCTDRQKTCRTTTDEDGTPLSVEVTREVAREGRAVISAAGARAIASALKDLRDIAAGAAKEDSSALKEARELLGGVDSAID